MHLTGEWFRNLISSLNGRAAEGEMRKSPRVGVRFSAWIRRLEDGRESGPIPIHVRDISAKGIGIAVKAKMQKGDQFVLELPQSNSKPLRVLCEVRNFTPVADHVHAIGAEFLRVGYEAARLPATPAPPPRSAPAAHAPAPAAAPAAVVSESTAPSPASVGVPAPAAALPPGEPAQDEDARAAEIRRAMFD